MQNLKTKQLTMESFGENLELYVDKLIIKTPFENDCVVIPIETYEKLKNLYDKVENQNFN